MKQQQSCRGILGGGMKQQQSCRGILGGEMKQHQSCRGILGGGNETTPKLSRYFRRGE